MKNFNTHLLLFIITFAVACSPAKKKDSDEEMASTEATEETTEQSVESRVFFVSPSEGDTLTTTFTVEMGLEGMEVEPAGAINEGFGHHHILVNMASWPEGEIIPATDSTIHYGQGQTSTELTLEPGEYMLSLQFADGVHSSYGESMAASINVVVKE
ncbi:MAG: DUF4399 domain-containing protein [Cyclobacteriaceae bacterium]